MHLKILASACSIFIAMLYSSMLSNKYKGKKGTFYAVENSTINLAGNTSAQVRDISPVRSLFAGFVEWDLRMSCLNICDVSKGLEGVSSS